MLVDTLQATSPDSLLFCMGISKTYAAAKRAGHPVIREFYADRDYDNSGSIVFRRQVGRSDPEQIAAKCVKACKTGKVTTVEGDEIDIAFESICFHSDTPGALVMGQSIRAGLQDAGIRIATAAEIAKTL